VKLPLAGVAAVVVLGSLLILAASTPNKSSPPIAGSLPEYGPDSSGLPRKPRIVKRDERGRTLVEIDVRGWQVEYSRDEAGRVIRKTWTHPRDRNNTWTRCWTYEAGTGRPIEEFDIVGNKKSLRYGEDGKVAESLAPDGFIEEAQQHRLMSLQTAESGARKPPITTILYNGRDHRAPRRSAEEVGDVLGGTEPRL
jgi:YD repeat-containing protein